MTFKTTKLRDAISFALAMSTIVGANAALAQEAAPQEQEATTLDRIEVTGTRIRQVDLETAQPVLQITRADIEKQGFQSVADILQNVSAVGAPALSRAQPLQAGENVGGQFISMRNLGPTRTLILVNGKRLGISTAGLQDVSLIPTAAVERIEVLKDGASSIYGSDAIAGVINIITRSGFDGATGQFYYGEYDDGDGETTRADFVMGFTGDRGSLTTAVEYRQEKEVMAADREFSAYPQGQWHPTRGWTPVSQWGAISAPSGTLVLDNGADWRDIANYHPINTDSGSAVGSIVDKSNPNAQTHLRTPLESRSLFVDGLFDITDAIRFRGSMMYTGRDAERQVAGYPFQSATQPNVIMSRDSWYNPLGTHHGYATPQDVHFVRRTWEIPRTDKPSSTTWRFASGFDGSFEIGSRYFDWDAGYLYNNNRVHQENYGNLNLERVRQAVGPSMVHPVTGQVICVRVPGDASTVIPGCIPWNPYIPYGRTGDGGLTNNADLEKWLFQTLNSSGETETKVFSANLAGSLFTLPGGDLGFAVGVESRKEAGEFTPDAMATTGNSTTLAAGPTKGDYSVDEMYAELALPLLADLPGAKELSFSVATRYSDYDTFGDTLNSKFGFKWKPMDSLLVRGTFAEGFRAPTISDLYGGGSQTFSNFQDPCDVIYGQAASDMTVRARCAADIVDADNFRQLAQGFRPKDSQIAQTPVPFMSGSNRSLTPELSESETLGLVWSPGFAEGLNVSLDWWNIRIEETIVADSPTQMLFDCYVQGIASRCAGFTRDAALGYVNNLTFGSVNAGYRETEGYDLDLSYRLPTDIGNFNLSWMSTYTSKDEILTSNSPTAVPQQLVGTTVTGGFLGTFRIRSTASLTWTKGIWSATWGARYFSGLRDTCLNFILFPDECSDRSFNHKGSTTFNDLEVRVTAPWNATIAIGANNVLDREGAQFYSAPSANVPYHGQFDIGRFMYLKYQQRF